MADRRIDIVVTSKVRDALSGLASVASSIGKIGIAGAGIASAGVAAVSVAAIRAAASYETLQLRLEAVTGSARKAAEIFKDVRAFAASTPLRLGDLVEARILLEGIGVTGQASLKKAAGAAAALNKPIVEVASSIASLETEPLRRMGIEVRRVGDQATFSFRDKFGRSIKTVANGIDDARQALLGIFDVKFGGFLEKASGTFDGLVSTLRDKLTEVGAQFGQQLLPAASGFVAYLNTKLDELIDSGFLVKAANTLLASLMTAKTLLAEAFNSISSGSLKISETFRVIIRGIIDAGSIIGSEIADGIILGIARSNLPGSSTALYSLEKSARAKLIEAGRSGAIDPRTILDYTIGTGTGSKEARLFQLEAQRGLLSGVAANGALSRLSGVGSGIATSLGLSDPSKLFQENMAKLSRSRFGVFSMARDNTGTVSGLRYQGTTTGPSSIDNAVRGNYVLVRDQGADENRRILSQMLTALRDGVPAVAQ